MSVAVLSWAQVCARRLERHGLARPMPGGGSAGIAGVVAAMCGAHAQVLSAGELSVAPRTVGAHTGQSNTGHPAVGAIPPTVQTHTADLP
jgi:hypothetical protein